MPGVDAVAIATPPLTHYEIVAEALRAGKHVLVEKPPTVTLEESKRLIALAKKTPGILYMAFHAQHSWMVERAVSLLTGTKHSIDRIAIEYFVDVLKDRDPEKWMFDRKQGGGILMDSGINSVSVLTRLFPRDFLRVTSARLRVPPGSHSEMEVDVAFQCGQKEGRLMMNGMHYGSPAIRIFLKHGKENVFVVDVTGNDLLVDGAVVRRTVVPRGTDWAHILHLGEYSDTYHDFVSHIERGVSSCSTRELQFILDAYKKAT